MQSFLIQVLVLINMLLVVSTVVNVIHKLQIIQGPNAHIAIAILSLLVLFGYSGVLNTIFLRRRFYRGRILYIILASVCQCVILLLSFLSFYNVMTYFDAIAIIHAIMGVIVMINFTCAVVVIREQQQEIDDDEMKSENAKLKRKIQALEILTKRPTYFKIDLSETYTKTNRRPLLLDNQEHSQCLEEDTGSQESSEISSEEVIKYPLEIPGEEQAGVGQLPREQLAEMSQCKESVGQNQSL